MQVRLTAANILVVTLNRPQVHNALTLDMWKTVAASLRTVPDDVRAAVIHGAGSSFCSGGDLPQLAAVFDSAESIGAFRRVISEAFAAISESSFPVIAAVDGAAMGGGAELALACDIRFATARAKLAMPGSRLGLALNEREIRRVVELIGPSRATSWLLTGASVGGREAQRWGLVDEIVADPFEAALELAIKIAANSAEVAEWTKGVVEARADSADLVRADDVLRRSGLASKVGDRNAMSDNKSEVLKS